MEKKTERELKGIYNQLELFYTKKARLWKTFRHVKKRADWKLVCIIKEINAQADERETNGNLSEGELEERRFARDMEITFYKLQAMSSA